VTAAENLTLETADGVRIEAELALPDDATALLVMCHPHPQYGGSMDAGLVDELFRSLPGRGLGVLRFNFRGVGASTGSFGGGVGERADVLAAVEVAAERAGGRFPVILGGWSFGADVSLTIDHPAAQGWVLVAAPLRITAAEDWVAPADDRPTLLLVPEHDQYRSPASAAEATAEWRATRVESLPGADHFVWGHASAIADHIVGFARSLAG